MVKIIKPDQRDCPDSVQSSGMRREAAISGDLTGSEGLWMGVGSNAPGHASAVHHHGHLESGIYITKGRIRFRWGRQLEHSAEAEPGDFIFVPPYEVHVEENMSQSEPTEFILARNGQQGIVVNVPDPREPAAT